MADPEAQARYQKLFSAELGVLLKQGHELLNQIVAWLAENDIDPESVSYPLFKVETDPKTQMRYITFTCLVNDQPVKIDPKPQKLEPNRKGRAHPPVDQVEPGTLNPVQESLERRN